MPQPGAFLQPQCEHLASPKMVSAETKNRKNHCGCATRFGTRMIAP